MTRPLNEQAIEQFWNNLQKGGPDECWLWTGKTGRRDTPLIRFTIDGVRTEFRPRQISLELHGKPMNKRVELLCDSKLCLNPNHLVSGDEQRFWSCVGKHDDKTQCWSWKGSFRESGYGAFCIRQDNKDYHMAASRYSYMLHHPNETLTPDVFICHTCDNPPCCNPDHLYAGTTQDNTKDRDQRGRKASTKGELNAMAVINSDQAKEIKLLLREGKILQSQIAKLLGVSNSIVGGIARGKTWKHIIV